MEPFVGEIRMFGGNFAPVDWALCQGQLLSIADNAALFSLIGTTYGGDGQRTFALPDLRSRVPLHAGTLSGGSRYVLGQAAGAEAVALGTGQLPQHNHPARGNSSAGTAANPTGAYWAANAEVKQYVAGSMANASMSGSSLQSTGGGQPHDNMLPFVVINFIISLAGTYPTRD